MSDYDVIVLGAGGVGSAAAFHAARRGLRTLALDRYPPGHDRGSSHGETRIIRQAYFEHPDYVPLLRRAYELWHELETLAGRRLFHQVGLLQVGPADGQVVAGVLESARRHALEVEAFDAREIPRRFPGFRARSDWRGVFERRAGYLLVEACVREHLQQAVRAGAELRTDVEALDWCETADGVQVRTAQGSWTASRLIVSAGPWAPAALRGPDRSSAVPVDFGLRVLRKHLYWFQPSSADYHERSGAPTFLYETSDGVFYGFPQRDELGVKAAEHSGGARLVDPRDDPREFDEADRERTADFLSTWLPQAVGPVVRHGVCYYTMSPDEHFLVDRHPSSARVVFAAGLSGHGFKFTSVLGEALVQLACDGSTPLPIEFLRADRPALRRS